MEGFNLSVLLHFLRSALNGSSSKYNRVLAGARALRARQEGSHFNLKFAIELGCFLN
jgi:hypothetical protein